MISKQEWTALNVAVAIAETAIKRGLLAPDAGQDSQMAEARHFLNTVEVKRPKAYLPSRHPNYQN